jgi:hypothetical protein
VRPPTSWAALSGIVRGLRPGPSPARPPLDLTKLDRKWLLAERERVLTRAERRMPPITRVVPVPRVVRLDGRRFVAGELTLGDLAELQAWLEEADPNPLDGLPPAWADVEPGTRPARLRALWDAAGEWPARLGTPAAGALLGTERGRAFFLCLCLRRHQPAFGLGDALALLPRVWPSEWAALRRVAYALTPREELVDELDPTPGKSRAGDWWKQLHAAAQLPHWPGYEGLARLTISQWRHLCSDGKAPEFGAEFCAAAKRARAALGG